MCEYWHFGAAQGRHCQLEFSRIRTASGSIVFHVQTGNDCSIESAAQLIAFLDDNCLYFRRVFVRSLIATCGFFSCTWCLFVMCLSYSDCLQTKATAVLVSHRLLMFLIFCFSETLCVSYVRLQCGAISAFPL